MKGQDHQGDREGVNDVVRPEWKLSIAFCKLKIVDKESPASMSGMYVTK